MFRPISRLPRITTQGLPLPVEETFRLPSSIPSSSTDVMRYDVMIFFFISYGMAMYFHGTHEVGYPNWKADMKLGILELYYQQIYPFCRSTGSGQLRR